MNGQIFSPKSSQVRKEPLPPPYDVGLKERTFSSSRELLIALGCVAEGSFISASTVPHFKRPLTNRQNTKATLSEVLPQLAGFCCIHWHTSLKAYRRFGLIFLCSFATLLWRYAANFETYFSWYSTMLLWVCLPCLCTNFFRQPQASTVATLRHCSPKGVI